VELIFHVFRVVEEIHGVDYIIIIFHSNYPNIVNKMYTIFEIILLLRMLFVFVSLFSALKCHPKLREFPEL